MNTNIPGIKTYIKQELLQLCETLWKKYDKGGYTDSKNLGLMLRLLEYNPTDRELKELINLLEEDPNNPSPLIPKGTISKEAFFTCVAKKERDTDSIEEFLQCFKIFDPEGRGVIEEKTLRFIMCKLGDDGLTEDEMDNMMKEVTPLFINIENETKFVRYVEFAKYMKGLFVPEPLDDPKKGKGGKGGKKK